MAAFNTGPHTRAPSGAELPVHSSYRNWQGLSWVDIRSGPSWVLSDTGVPQTTFKRANMYVISPFGIKHLIIVTRRKCSIPKIVILLVNLLKYQKVLQAVKIFFFNYDNFVRTCELHIAANCYASAKKENSS